MQNYEKKKRIIAVKFIQITDVYRW